MNQRSNFRSRRPDPVAEEMTAVLLEGGAYEFNDLFAAVHQRLRSRQADRAGEEMLRLRVYEKLQLFVAQGAVTKKAKIYSGVRLALLARSAATSAAAAPAPPVRRRRSVLSAE